LIELGHSAESEKERDRDTQAARYTSCAYDHDNPIPPLAPFPPNELLDPPRRLISPNAHTYPHVPQTSLFETKE